MDNEKTDSKDQPEQYKFGWNDPRKDPVLALEIELQKFLNALYRYNSKGK